MLFYTNNVLLALLNIKIIHIRCLGTTHSSISHIESCHQVHATAPLM